MSPEERQKVIKIVDQLSTILQTAISCGCNEFSGVLKDFRLGDPIVPPPPEPDPCNACKDTVCKDVPDGKIRLVICDGKTLKTWAGTANNQYPKWDSTLNTWYLSNI